jgi:hypothetical protein
MRSTPAPALALGQEHPGPGRASRALPRPAMRARAGKTWRPAAAGSMAARRRPTRTGFPPVAKPGEEALGGWRPGRATRARPCERRGRGAAGLEPIRSSAGLELAAFESRCERAEAVLIWPRLRAVSVFDTARFRHAVAPTPRGFDALRFRCRAISYSQPRAIFRAYGAPRWEGRCGWTNLDACGAAVDRFGLPPFRCDARGLM